ncbi:MAG: hypothetical protein MHMPM18_001174 [Marteilia pararefringens]
MSYNLGDAQFINSKLRNKNSESSARTYCPGAKVTEDLNEKLGSAPSDTRLQFLDTIQAEIDDGKASRDWFLPPLTPSNRRENDFRNNNDEFLQNLQKDSLELSLTDLREDLRKNVVSPSSFDARFPKDYGGLGRDSQPSSQQFLLSETEKLNKIEGILSNTLEMLKLEEIALKSLSAKQKDTNNDNENPNHLLGFSRCEFETIAAESTPFKGSSNRQKNQESPLCNKMSKINDSP